MPAQDSEGSAAPPMAEETIFLTSQIEAPRTGSLSFEDQVRDRMEILGEALRVRELDFSSVVKANVYLTDLSLMEQMNRVYRGYFTKHPPARTTVQMADLPGGSAVEICLIASRIQERNYHYPDGLQPTPDDLFSASVEAGNLLYLSGRTSRHYLTREFPEGEFPAHVRQSLENLGATLRAAGLDFADVVRAEVYLDDMKNLQQMEEVYRQFFPSNPPAQTVIGVAALPGGSPIEITLLAGAKEASASQAVWPEGVASEIPFSPAWKIGNVLLISGKAGVVSKGVGAMQLAGAIGPIGRVLKEAGMDLSHVVDVKTYMVDIDSYPRVRHELSELFPEPSPAKFYCVVGGLIPGAELELAITAAGPAVNSLRH